MFGRDLMRYCRAEALKSADPTKLPKSAEEFREQIAAAVDVALHNVVDLLEGFFPMEAGPNHKVSDALSVCVQMRREPRESESTSRHLSSICQSGTGSEKTVSFDSFCAQGCQPRSNGFECSRDFRQLRQPTVKRVPQ